MQPAPSPAEHQPAPQADTVYSWHGMVSTGQSISDYPLQAICTCDQRAIRPDRHSPWRHRLPDEQINEPADAEF